MSVSHGSWTIEREYPHPPDQVFAAWSDPGTKILWFDLSGSADSDYRSDFRVGGTESFHMREGVAPRFTYDAQYRDIVEDERIVTTYEMSMDGRRISVSVATVELSATPAGTRLVYTEQGAFLDGLDDAASRRSGTTAQLDALATVLKERA
ncbi:MAG TPA: SRPBCC family protein [Kineosporiaceae bacterium]|nr:SRPBCC family protein [Kineosporiaceae bacterium]